VRRLLAPGPDREAVTPFDLFSYIVAVGAGLAVVAIGALVGWVILNYVSDLVQKWVGR